MTRSGGGRRPTRSRPAKISYHPQSGWFEDAPHRGAPNILAWTSWARGTDTASTSLFTSPSRVQGSTVLPDTSLRSPRGSGSTTSRATDCAILSLVGGFSFRGLGGSTQGETTSSASIQRRTGVAYSSRTAIGGGLPVEVKLPWPPGSPSTPGEPRSPP